MLSNFKPINQYKLFMAPVGAMGMQCVKRIHSHVRKDFGSHSKYFHGHVRYDFGSHLKYFMVTSEMILDPTPNISWSCQILSGI